MSQTHTRSALEAATNVAIGWVLALGVQLLLFPVIGLQVTLTQNIAVSSIFTVVSLVRSYVLRRGFLQLDKKGRSCHGRS